MLSNFICSICHNSYIPSTFSTIPTCSTKCTARHIGDKLIEKNNKIKNEKIIEYNKNPTYCLYCKNTMPFEKRKNKFCNASHAAYYNNNQKINPKKETSISKPIITDETLYPTRFKIRIKRVATYLNKSEKLITYGDVKNFKEYLESLLHIDNLSPREIVNKLNIKCGNPSDFMKQLHIKLKSPKDAQILRKSKNKKPRIPYSDEKKEYRYHCRFIFDPFLYPKIINYDLLFLHKFYHPQYNKNGLNLDHMISLSYGWENKISPDMISHPANCAVLFASDNFRKNSGCSISLEELKERILMWNSSNDSSFIISKSTKSKEHRKKISNAIMNLRCYTNGSHNIKQHKDLIPPAGYKLGMTKKKRIKLI